MTSIRNGVAAGLSAALVAAAACSTEPGSENCGLAVAESQYAFCAASGDQMCDCSTNRCARRDSSGCASGWRYAYGGRECLSDELTAFLRESNSLDDRCEGTDADAGADADGDGDADADADADDTVGPDADADGDGDGDADSDGDADADADADAGGLVLHAAGFATVAGEGLAAGSMRLTEVGFEGGGRSCAGSLCLWVGVMP